MLSLKRRRRPSKIRRILDVIKWLAEFLLLLLEAIKKLQDLF